MEQRRLFQSREEGGGLSVCMVQYLKRITIYVAGLLFVAFGVAFSINSNLGVSPVNSLPYVISLISGMELGTCIIAVYSFYILLQIIIFRNEFKWVNLTQVLFSFLFGYFTDFSKWVMGDFAIPGYPGRLLMLLASIILIAVGLSLYVDVRLVNMPMEGLTHAISEKVLKGKPFHETKVIVDCTAVGLSILFSLVFLRRLEGVREGTVISALLIGKVMKPIQKRLLPWIEEHVFQE